MRSVVEGVMVEAVQVSERQEKVHECVVGAGARGVGVSVGRVVRLHVCKELCCVTERVCSAHRRGNVRDTMRKARGSRG